MLYSVMDEFEDLFGPIKDIDPEDTGSGSDSLRVSFDPLEEFLNEEL